MHLGLPFLLVAATLTIAAVAFLYAREQASRSPEARRKFLRGGAIGVVIGLVIAFGSWKVLPTNPESPAMLITYFASFVVGGGMILLSVLVVVGAFSVTPKIGTMETRQAPQ